METISALELKQLIKNGKSQAEPILGGGLMAYLVDEKIHKKLLHLEKQLSALLNKFSKISKDQFETSLNEIHESDDFKLIANKSNGDFRYKFDLIGSYPNSICSQIVYSGIIPLHRKLLSIHYSKSRIRKRGRPETQGKVIRNHEEEILCVYYTFLILVGNIKKRFNELKRKELKETNSYDAQRWKRKFRRIFRTLKKEFASTYLMKNKKERKDLFRTLEEGKNAVGLAENIASKIVCQQIHGNINTLRFKILPKLRKKYPHHVSVFSRQKLLT